MIDSKNDTDQLWEKILAGIKKANTQLVIHEAALNRSLVIGNKDGSWQVVPAKELLKTLSEK